MEATNYIASKSGINLVIESYDDFNSPTTPLPSSVRFEHFGPVTRDDVWQLLDSLDQCDDLTPAAKRMIQHGKRARHAYRTVTK